MNTWGKFLLVLGTVGVGYGMSQAQTGREALGILLVGIIAVPVFFIGPLGGFD